MGIPMAITITTTNLIRGTILKAISLIRGIVLKVIGLMDIVLRVVVILKAFAGLVAVLIVNMRKR
jgi:hypothetical protein